MIGSRRSCGTRRERRVTHGRMSPWRPGCRPARTPGGCAAKEVARSCGQRRRSAGRSTWYNRWARGGAFFRSTPGVGPRFWMDFYFAVGPSAHNSGRGERLGHLYRWPDVHGSSNQRRHPATPGARCRRCSTRWIPKRACGLQRASTDLLGVQTGKFLRRRMSPLLACRRRAKQRNTDLCQLISPLRPCRKCGRAMGAGHAHWSRP